MDVNIIVCGEVDIAQAERVSFAMPAPDASTTLQAFRKSINAACIAHDPIWPTANQLLALYRPPEGSSVAVGAVDPDAMNYMFLRDGTDSGTSLLTECGWNGTEPFYLYPSPRVYLSSAGGVGTDVESIMSQARASPVSEALQTMLHEAGLSEARHARLYEDLLAACRVPHITCLGPLDANPKQRWLFFLHGPPASPYAGARVQLELDLGDHFPLLAPKLHVDPPLKHLHIVASPSSVHAEAPARTGRVDLRCLRPTDWSPRTSLLFIFASLVQLLQAPVPPAGSSTVRQLFHLSHSLAYEREYCASPEAFASSAAEHARTHAMPDPDDFFASVPTRALSLSARLAASASLRAAGNARFGAGALPAALHFYTKALAYCNDSEPSAYNERARVLLNRSAVFLQTAEYRSAASDARSALGLDAPELPRAKALFRLARALRMLSEFDEARSSLEAALALEPGDAALLHEKRELDRVSQAHARSEAAVCRNMFSS